MVLSLPCCKSEQGVMTQNPEFIWLGSRGHFLTAVSFLVSNLKFSYWSDPLERNLGRFMSWFLFWQM
jgi:hypothetical protein